MNNNYNQNSNMPSVGGYISSTSGDIRDASIFLTKSLFVLTVANSELQNALWFKQKTGDPYNKFFETTRLFYMIYSYTMSHFRDTIKHKLSKENLDEIKTTLEETDNFFKRIKKISWDEGQTNLDSMANDLDTLINSYLNALNMIGLHKIGINHEFQNPENAYAGMGAV